MFVFKACQSFYDRKLNVEFDQTRVEEVHNKLEVILKVVSPLSHLHLVKSKDSKGCNTTPLRLIFTNLFVFVINCCYLAGKVP